MERIEALSGPPRSTFRRNDQVVTFLPDTAGRRVPRSARTLDLFPEPAERQRRASIAEFYGVRAIGEDRVAGFDTDVVQFEPRDGCASATASGASRRSGLVVKLQTLDRDGNVLEQSAFSELQLDAPVQVDKLCQMMAAPHGWRVEKAGAASARRRAAEGWATPQAVAGFKPVNCYPAPDGAAEGRWCTPCSGSSPMGWPPCRCSSSPTMRSGTRSEGCSRSAPRRRSRVTGKQRLVAHRVGEVPPQTLKRFRAEP